MSEHDTPIGQGMAVLSMAWPQPPALLGYISLTASSRDVRAQGVAESRADGWTKQNDQPSALSALPGEDWRSVGERSRSPANPSGGSVRHDPAQRTEF